VRNAPMRKLYHCFRRPIANGIPHEWLSLSLLERHAKSIVTKSMFVQRLEGNSQYCWGLPNGQSLHPTMESWAATDHQTHRRYRNSQARADPKTSGLVNRPAKDSQIFGAHYQCLTKPQFSPPILPIVDDTMIGSPVFQHALHQPGPAPRLSDSELVTIAPYQELIGEPFEDHFFRLHQASLRTFLPGLNERSRYSRRKQDLWSVILAVSSSCSASSTSCNSKRRP
jgi:hypothetical protein